MAIKIEISGFDKDFLPVFESLAKSLKATYCLLECDTPEEKKQSSMKKALEEMKNGEYETFKNFGKIDLSQKPILPMFSLSNGVFNPFRFNYRKNSCGFVNIIMRI